METEDVALMNKQDTKTQRPLARAHGYKGVVAEKEYFTFNPIHCVLYEVHFFYFRLFVCDIIYPSYST